MKISKFIQVVFALALTVFGSCSQDDDDKVTYDDQVRFTAGIKQEATHSRAANNAWAPNDAIGIFMVGSGTTQISMEAVNKKYIAETGATGAFTASSDADRIYYPQAGKVDFIAYYPWKEAQALGDYNVVIETTQTPVNQPTFDLLYAVADNEGKGFDKLTPGNVAFAFEHKLSNLTLRCKADASIQVPITDMTVSITGMNTETTFDLTTGVLSATHSAPKPITPRELNLTPAGFDVACDAIILPRTVANSGDVTVEFTLNNGELFVWKVPAGTEFKEGKKHIYEITLRRTEVHFNATIQPWIEVPAEQGIAE